ncbi:MAG: hypothetical protein CSYNP_01570 [Syntrophus sp. SKADARSKE-3]|nr:hypothetical protein [Syntrophus sp. SKADARSKE-3]
MRRFYPLDLAEIWWWITVKTLKKASRRKWETAFYYFCSNTSLTLAAKSFLENGF